jgi:alcohol dehydrogenase (NADP+)
LNPDRIKRNIDLFDWSLSDEEWQKVNSFEPQACLFGNWPVNLSESGPGFFSGRGPLQAVDELQDDE